jgi:hypothetical protein
MGKLVAPAVKLVEEAGQALRVFEQVILSKKDHLVAGAVSTGREGEREGEREGGRKEKSRWRTRSGRRGEDTDRSCPGRIHLPSSLPPSDGARLGGGQLAPGGHGEDPSPDVREGGLAGEGGRTGGREGGREKGRVGRSESKRGRHALLVPYLPTSIPPSLPLYLGNLACTHPMDRLIPPPSSPPSLTASA